MKQHSSYCFPILKSKSFFWMYPYHTFWFVSSWYIACFLFYSIKNNGPLSQHLMCKMTSSQNNNKSGSQTIVQKSLNFINTAVSDKTKKNRAYIPLTINGVEKSMHIKIWLLFLPDCIFRSGCNNSKKLLGRRINHWFLGSIIT